MTAARTTVAVVLLALCLRTDARDLFHIRFQLDWYPNAQFAGLFVANERGWFREVGLDVTFAPVDAEMKVVGRVVSDGDGMGCSESGVLLDAAARGAPIMILGTMLQGSPMALVSLAGHGYTNLAALRGKALGIHPDGRRALELIIAHDGFHAEDFRIIEKEHDLSPLLNGAFDAVQGYLIDEAVALEVSNHRAIDVIPFREHGYAAYSQVYFTSQSFWARHPDKARAFLKAARRGWLEAIVDPAAAAALVISKYAPTLDPAYQTRSLERVADLAVAETGLDGLGQFRRDTWIAALAAFERDASLPGHVDLDPILAESAAKFAPWSRDQLRAERRFREPGGSYPPPPNRLRAGANGRLLVMVDAAGRPARILPVTTPDKGGGNADAAWIEANWRWPAGSNSRRYLVPLPAPAQP
jgi:NitT/TauT family transport system substrate-binding protein